MGAMLDAFAQFHFLRPLWLWALLPAGLLIWVVGWRDDVRRRWRATIAPHLLDALVVERRGAWRVRPVHLTSALIALGAIAMAGPTWQRERPPFVEEKAPLAIAIDLSQGMDAIDVSPTRLERAKLKVKALLDQRQGARTAVYAYAGSTHLVLPLTDDSKLIQTFVDALQTRIMPVAGKNTALALRTIDAALVKEDTPGTIVFFTDGVEAAASAAFKAQVDSGRSLPVVLAFGTAQGGPVRAGGGFAQDASGQQLFSKLDVDALKRLKSDADVPVATVTLDSDDDVQWVQRRVQSHLAQKESETNARWKESGWWLTIPIALLGALWFRKGWTVRWVSALLLTMLLGVPQHDALAQAPGPDADASNDAPSPALPATRPKRFIDLWLTHDQQGRRAFEDGNFAAAAALFDDPMWRGIALYRAGQFAQAVQSFALVDSPESDFNQGDALAQQKQYKQAASRFEQALKRRPDWQAAQANLALMKKLTPPPKKDDPNEDEQAPDLPPDQIKFDEQGKKGQQQMQLATTQSAETWMRNIQTTPTELLARKFALQVEGGTAKPAEAKP
ncbi:VWA domain-containing protein [Variovorax sp. J22R133]|uniref:VWA domain-containing protein n=1 Tax=Variovorax brevis TaxID=3053503 RepID=UPI0025786962|nr:VWA domain-containing protein [Variovorax sp. J22R133]MDM0111076.1 VWA domain-containing protein [Variovorax sp. J22R133]